MATSRLTHTHSRTHALRTQLQDLASVCVALISINVRISCSFKVGSNQSVHNNNASGPARSTRAMGQQRLTMRTSRSSAPNWMARSKAEACDDAGWCYSRNVDADCAAANAAATEWLSILDCVTRQTEQLSRNKATSNQMWLHAHRNCDWPGVFFVVAYTCVCVCVCKQLPCCAIALCALLSQAFVFWNLSSRRSVARWLSEWKIKSQSDAKIFYLKIIHFS